MDESRKQHGRNLFRRLSPHAAKDGESETAASIPPSTGTICTVGLCRPDGLGGWACVGALDEALREESGGDVGATEARMELTAALKGLAATPLESSVVVHTQSQMLYHGMTKKVAQWRRQKWIAAGGQEVEDRDLWEQLWDAASGRQVRWEWLRLTNAHTKPGPISVYYRRAYGLAGEAMRRARVERADGDPRERPEPRERAATAADKAVEPAAGATEKEPRSGAAVEYGKSAFMGQKEPSVGAKAADTQDWEDRMYLGPTVLRPGGGAKGMTPPPSLAEQPMDLAEQTAAVEKGLQMSANDGTTTLMTEAPAPLHGAEERRGDTRGADATRGGDDRRRALLAECRDLERRLVEAHEQLSRLDAEWQRLLRISAEDVGGVGGAENAAGARAGRVIGWAEDALLFSDLTVYASRLSDLAADGYQTCQRYAATLRQALEK